MDSIMEQARNIDLQWFGEGSDPAPAVAADNQAPAQEPHADAPPAGVAQGNGNVPRWIYQAEKTLQDDKRLHKFGTLSEAAKALLDYEGKSERTVEIPGEDATPEQQAAFYARLGRPEQAEQYTLKTPEGFTDDGYIKTLRETAHAAGLSQKQAQSMLDSYAGARVAQAKASTEARDTAYAQGLGELKKLWGVRYEERLDTAKRFMDKAGGEAALAAIAGSGLDNHPAVIAMFAQAGEMLGPDRFFEGNLPKVKAGPYPYMKPRG